MNIAGDARHTSPKPVFLFFFLAGGLLFLSGRPKVITPRETMTINGIYTGGRVTPLVKGLRHPHGLSRFGKDALLVTERPGKIWVLRQEKKIFPVQGLPLNISQKGRGGWFDIIHHDNGWIYLSYSGTPPNKPNSSLTSTILVRFRLSPPNLRTNPDSYMVRNLETLFRSEPFLESRIHYGGGLAVDSSDNIFLGVGDRGLIRHSRDTSTHLGSILRLKLNGSVPEDNPLRFSSESLSGLPPRPEIYSYGHNDIQELFYHKKDGSLFSRESDARKTKEINLIRAGKNYGGESSSKKAETRPKTPAHTEFETPIHFWEESPKIAALLKENKNESSLAEEDIYRIALGLDEPDDTLETPVKLFTRETGHIRSIRTADENIIYLISNLRNGALIKAELFKE